MEISVATITVREGKAYIPTQGQSDSGYFVNIEPIYICELTLQEIVTALQKVLEAGHPLIHIRTPEEGKKYSDLMLRATRTKSWKELGKTGISYSIGFSSKGIRIEMSRLDKHGRWEFDPEKRRELPNKTPLKEIVEIILEDVKSRQ
jgi:hypothetical protein